MAFSFKYGLLKGISNLLCMMSHRRILSIGRFLGPAIMNRIQKQRNRGIEQIMTGTGMDRPAAEALLTEVYEHIGMSVMEMLWMPRLCAARDHIGDYVKIDHPENIEEAFANGKGIVALTGHVGNWEWLGAGVALHGYNVSAIAKKQRDDAVMQIINDYRAASGEKIFLTGTDGYEMIPAARALRKNYFLGFLSDKDGDKVGVPVVFMNRIFSFPPGPAVFARKFKSPIMPIFITRDKDNTGHTVHAGKPFYYEDTGDERKDMLVNSQKMADLLEDFIKKYPADWLWFQHLFWTEPERVNMYNELTEEERAELLDRLKKRKEAAHAERQ